MAQALKQTVVEETNHLHSIGDARARLLSTIPLVERKLDLAGVRTAVLEGGDGSPRDEASWVLGRARIVRNLLQREAVWMW